MKILQIITRGELGGGQKHVMDLINGFAGRHELEVATGEAGYLQDSAAAAGVQVHMLRYLVQPISPWNDFMALREISRLIARTRPDLVHTHTSKAGAVGRLAAWLNGVPSLFTAHTWCFAEGTSWKWKLIGTPLEKIAARCCGAIITVSEKNRRLALERGVGSPDKLITIHNGAPDSPHRANPGEAVAEPRIAMVARFAPQKAQAELIRAVAGIEEPLRVWFVGDGPTRAAHEALAEELGVRGRIDFLGERRDIAEVLAGAHIFALPTNWEGFPLTILEAMRGGLPVVASDVGGVAEAVEAGKTGFLARAGAADQFRDHLRKLVVDRALREAQGAAGRERFEREFTVEAMLKKTSAVYAKVLAGGKVERAAAGGAAAVE